MLQMMGMELGSLLNQKELTTKEFLLWKVVFYNLLNKHF